MCNTAFHKDEINGVLGYDLICAKKDYAENSLKIQLPTQTNSLERSITKSAACETDFTLCLEDSKSPIVDVTQSVSIASSSETILNMDISNENVSAFKFARINSVNQRPMAHLNSCNSLPLPFPNLGVLPISGGTLLSNKPSLPAFEYIATPNLDIPKLDFHLMDLNRVGMFPGLMQRRPRGEKRPIPEEQKDEKYYERRKRNNEAAKKSRDARKIREDRIAFRAALLEQENSILRAQVLALRDELQTVRQLLAINGLA